MWEVTTPNFFPALGLETSPNTSQFGNSRGQVRARAPTLGLLPHLVLWNGTVKICNHGCFTVISDA